MWLSSSALQRTSQPDFRAAVPKAVIIGSVGVFKHFWPTPCFSQDFVRPALTTCKVHLSSPITNKNGCLSLDELRRERAHVRRSGCQGWLRSGCCQDCDHLQWVSRRVQNCEEIIGVLHARTYVRAPHTIVCGAVVVPVTLPLLIHRAALKPPRFASVTPRSRVPERVRDGGSSCRRLFFTGGLF